MVDRGRAVHWLAIFEFLWPDFEQEDYYAVELGYIVFNGPEKDFLPDAFYQQLASILATLWRIQLEDLYPDGNWKVVIHDDPEMTVDATIYR
jgi:hypothetical protein